MPLTDDLQLVPVTTRPGKIGHGRLAVTVQRYRDRTEVAVSKAAMTETGWQSGTHVQVFVSASTIQLRSCTPDAEGARRINKSQRLLNHELGGEHFWRMPDGERVVIPVEVIGANGRSSLVGTIPPEFREVLAYRGVIRGA